jgi:hypothetical protein
MTSTIKVNKIEKESGSTLTIGGPGTAVTLAPGASQTGFGTPSSSVLWCTTAKTSPFTAADKVGYFVNTTGGTITVTLPSSPSAGDVVAIKDYAGTFDSNAVTVGRGGSKIGGLCLDATLNTEGDSVTLVYVDGTKGWINIQTDDTVVGNAFLTATGGTVVTCGNFKTHIFTSSGTFTVSATATSAADNVVDYLVVAGGGGGSLSGPEGAGAGAGGFRYFSQLSPAGSPLVAPAGITVTATGFPISVGAGGARRLAPAGCGAGCNGGTSSFSTITSAGGGGGGQYPAIAGAAGGSGGGGGTNCGSGGSGNTPPVSPAQGTDGGSASGAIGPGSNPVHRAAGAGGGAGAAGGDGDPGGGGGGGIGSNIPDGFIGPTAPSYGEAGPAANTRYFAGGGGGGAVGSTPNRFGQGGIGGGGNGGQGGPAPVVNAENGSTNMGGGSGGVASSPACIGIGGSGIVMIRYKFQ